MQVTFAKWTSRRKSSDPIFAQERLTPMDTRIGIIVTLLGKGIPLYATVKCWNLNAAGIALRMNPILEDLSLLLRQNCIVMTDRRITETYIQYS